MWFNSDVYISRKQSKKKEFQPERNGDGKESESGKKRYKQHEQDEHFGQFDLF